MDRDLANAHLQLYKWFSNFSLFQFEFIYSPGLKHVVDKKLQHLSRIGAIEYLNASGILYN